MNETGQDTEQFVSVQETYDRLIKTVVTAVDAVIECAQSIRHDAGPTQPALYAMVCFLQEFVDRGIVSSREVGDLLDM